MKKTKINIGKMLLNWRTSHGYTRPDAAQRLEISARTIEGWETGRRHPCQPLAQLLFQKLKRIL